MIFILDKSNSSRAIVKEAIVLCHQNKKNAGNILFVRRVPYSGYFYGGSLILPHGEEPVEESIERGLKDKSTVFVMKTKYYDRILPQYGDKLQVRKKYGKWIIATVSLEK